MRDRFRCWEVCRRRGLWCCSSAPTPPHPPRQPSATLLVSGAASPRGSNPQVLFYGSCAFSFFDHRKKQKERKTGTATIGVKIEPLDHGLGVDPPSSRRYRRARGGTRQDLYRQRHGRSELRRYAIGRDESRPYFTASRRLPQVGAPFMAPNRVGARFIVPDHSRTTLAPMGAVTHFSGRMRRLPAGKSVRGVALHRPAPTERGVTVPTLSPGARARCRCRGGWRGGCGR